MMMGAARGADGAPESEASGRGASGSEGTQGSVSAAGDGPAGRRNPGPGAAQPRRGARGPGRPPTAAALARRAASLYTGRGQGSPLPPPPPPPPSPPPPSRSLVRAGGRTRGPPPTPSHPVPLALTSVSIANKTRIVRPLLACSISLSISHSLSTYLSIFLSVYPYMSRVRGVSSPLPHLEQQVRVEHVRQLSHHPSQRPHRLRLPPRCLSGKDEASISSVWSQTKIPAVCTKEYLGFIPPSLHEVLPLQFVCVQLPVNGGHNITIVQ